MEKEIYKIPNHVAFILDGNGRYAQERGLPRSEGHRLGYENLISLSKYIFSKGIKELSVFAFSTENFKRSKEEVDYLMNLFATKFKTQINQFNKSNIKVVFSGIKASPLPQKVITAIETIEEKTKDNDGGIFNICINYGSHQEIVEATKKITQDVIDTKLKLEEIDENVFSHYLYQDLSPVDLLIRTSGELRISNFMLWQISYAELYFPKTYFPAFTNEDFDLALKEYTARDRRFGGINYEEKNN